MDSDITKIALIYFKPKVFYISTSNMDWNFNDIPKKIETTIFNIDSKKYRGYIPDQVPTLQCDGLNFQGPEIINKILNLVRNAQDDYYKK